MFSRNKILIISFLAIFASIVFTQITLNEIQGETPRESLYLSRDLAVYMHDIQRLGKQVVLVSHHIEYLSHNDVDPNTVDLDEEIKKLKFFSIIVMSRYADFDDSISRKVTTKYIDMDKLREINESLIDVTQDTIKMIDERKVDFVVLEHVNSDVDLVFAELKKLFDAHANDAMVSLSATELSLKKLNLSMYMIFITLAFLFILQVYKEKKTRNLASKLRETVREAVNHKIEADVANRAKTQFLATMSHELRTPLTAIIGYSEMMVIEFKGPLSDEYKSYAQQINNSSNHLCRIIGDIIDVSKIETDNFEIEQDYFSVNSLFDTVLDINIRKIKDKGIKFTLTKSTDEVMITGDKTRIQQILSNLLTNSCKFTEEGEIKLDMFIDEYGLNFIVTDTGRGMSEETLKNYFTSFYRAPDAMAIEGSGLGAAIIKKLVEAHNGKITVESELCIGTRVTVALPHSILSNK